MKFYLYKITNPSNNVYIGQTRNIKKRISSYKNLDCKSQKILYFSILKHGWKNHKFEIIEEIDCSQEYINNLEINYIKLYKEKNESLNILNGGIFGPNVGNSMPKGKDHYFSKPIYKYSLEKVLLKKYDSISEAAKDIGVSSSLFSIYFKRKNYLIKNFLWASEEMFNLGIIPEKKNSKEIVKLSLNAKYIETCLVSDVTPNKVGHLHQRIHNCLNFKLKSAGGYMWFYKDYYDNNKDNIKGILLNEKRTRIVKQ